MRLKRCSLGMRAVIAAMAIAVVTPAYAEPLAPPQAAVATVRRGEGDLVSRPFQLSDVIRKAARENSGLVEQPTPPKRWSCKKGLATGTAIGAGIGAFLSVALLHGVANGGQLSGRDYLQWVSHGFTGTGALAGLMLGSRNCGQ